MESTLIVISIVGGILAFVVPFFAVNRYFDTKIRRTNDLCLICGGKMLKRRVLGYFDETYLIKWCPDCQKDPPGDLYLNMINGLIPKHKPKV